MFAVKSVLKTLLNHIKSLIEVYLDFIDNVSDLNMCELQNTRLTKAFSTILSKKYFKYFLKISMLKAFGNNAWLANIIEWLLCDVYDMAWKSLE